VTVLRVEDIDRPRVVPGAEERQLEDLAWLGLEWDEAPGVPSERGPYRQSERTRLYDVALALLTERGRTYACDCSRAEIARVASAPHEGEEVVYPGTCRDKDPSRAMRRAPATRLKVLPGDAVDWVDAIAGPQSGGVLSKGGDFVLARGDGVVAYQLAVSVDDLAMGMTDVVRGDDLLASTPRQLLVMRLLSEGSPFASAEARPLPRYHHLPLVRAHDGSRLEKRTPRATVRELRDAGVSAATLVGQMAHVLGLVPSPAALSAEELLQRTGPETVMKPHPWLLPDP
jgi:glutamyl-tRNA synthetase